VIIMNSKDYRNIREAKKLLKNSKKIMKSNLEEWRKADNPQERLEWLEKVGKLGDEEMLSRLFDVMFDYNSPHSKGLASFILEAGVDPQALLETAKKHAEKGQ
tara:strand:+ start:197 stop:505 length:309 start_codon:yes stop_codon:yes gene_type:complete